MGAMNFPVRLYWTPFRPEAPLLAAAQPSFGETGTTDNEQPTTDEVNPQPANCNL
jgi:hypothetical protein